MSADSPCTNSRGEPLDPERVARTTVEPYPHAVRIVCNGRTLAETTRGMLLREGYAPDIYIPRADVNMACLEPGDAGRWCPYKAGTARHFHAVVDGVRIDDVAWCYETPADRPEIAGLVAFYFAKVRVEVDGELVRGHVRDPHKVIAVDEVPHRLRMTLAGRAVVDSERALVLHETGLPDRYYVPREDVDSDCLAPSRRQSVCTYKGEATYHHLRVGEREIENVVWVYDAPWTDFSADVGRITGHLGLYSSAFEEIWLDDEKQPADAAAADADRRMIAKPTVDAPLREKLGAVS